MLVHDVSHDFFRLYWAFSSINLVYLLLNWPFYNFKSFKPNGSAGLFGRRNRRLLVTFLELFIPPVQWPDLVFARVLVKILLLPAKISLQGLLPLRAVALLYQPLLWHMLLLLTPPSKWPELVLPVALAETFYWSNIATMSLPNKLQELWLIAVALALLLSFLLTLTVSFASHSSIELFTELKELTDSQKAPTNKQWLLDFHY